MKSLVLVAALIVVLNGSVMAGDPPRPTPPSQVAKAYDARWTEPVWVPASAAFDSKGDLRNDLFDEATRKRFDRLRKKNSGAECEVFVGPPSELPHVSGSLDERTQRALAIAAGTVIEAEQGFYFGSPATAFAIHVDERLKAFGRASRNAEIVRIVVNQAKITTAKGMVCSTPGTDARVPQVGDRVLVFAYVDPIDEDGRIFQVNPRADLIIERDNHLLLPSQFEGFKALHDVLRAVRENPRVNQMPERQAEY